MIAAHGRAAEGAHRGQHAEDGGEERDARGDERDERDGDQRAVDRGRARAGPAQLRREQREEGRREHRVQPQRARVAKPAADEGTGQRAEVPADEDAHAGRQERAVRGDTPGLCARHRGRLVDDQLGLHRAAQRPAAQHGCEGHAVDAVARGEQQRGRHGGEGAPAGAEHADDGELRGAGEDQERHRARLRDGQAGGHRQDAVGDPVGPGRQSDGEGVALDGAERHPPKKAKPGGAADPAFSALSCPFYGMICPWMPSIAQSCATCRRTAG
jgi:ATP-dependent RNA helicase DeaD